MFKEICTLPIAIGENKYQIVLGLNIEDGATTEEIKQEPIVCALFKEIDGKMTPFEKDDSVEFKQIDMTARVYTKGFIDGCQTTIMSLNESGMVEDTNDKPKLEI